MYAAIVITIILSMLHFLLGAISFATGVLSTIHALVWLAHTISPIFAGTFFILCGTTALLLLKHRTQYSILCFASLNSITLITAVVNLQLLRLGLVNHTTIGRTFQKENKDAYIIVAIIADGLEILVCTLSLVMCLKLNYDSKTNRFKSHKKEGVFFVQIVSDKDIVVVQPKKRLRSASSASRSCTSLRSNSPKKSSPRGKTPHQSPKKSPQANKLLLPENV